METSSIDYAHFKREFISGGIAGGIGIFIGFPLDLIKINLQFYPERYKSTLHCFRSTLKENGLRSLYRGCVPPIVTQGLLNSVLFGGEATAMKILQPGLKRGEPTTAVDAFIAGFAGGVAQSIFSVPVEVVKCNMQASHAAATTSFLRETIDSIKQIYRTEGFRGYFKGYSVTISRDVPSLGVYFLTYRYLRQQITMWEGRNEPSMFATLVAGALAGATSWSCVYPFDVIKTYSQVAANSTTAPPPQSSSSSNSIVSGDSKAAVSSASNSTSTNSAPRGLIAQQSVNNMTKMNMKDIAVNLYQRYGIRIFFRGLGVTVIRALPVNAATFYFYELINDCFRM